MRSGGTTLAPMPQNEDRGWRAFRTQLETAARGKAVKLFFSVQYYDGGSRRLACRHLFRGPEQLFLGPYADRDDPPGIEAEGVNAMAVKVSNFLQCVLKPEHEDGLYLALGQARGAHGESEQAWPIPRPLPQTFM